MSAEVAQTDSEMNREITCTEEARNLEEGDRLEITYMSTFGENAEKTITATVSGSEFSAHVQLGSVDLLTDEETSRQDYYQNDAADRQIEFLCDDIELKMKNGTRWQRLSKIGTDPTVKRIEA